MLYNKKWYPWLVVGLLWVVALLNYLDRQMLSTMRPSMEIDIEELQSATNFGRLMAVFLWIYGFVSPFAGMLADKLNKKWLIVSSLFIWSGVTYAMSRAESFQELYWLRAIMGFSEAIYIPTALALIVGYHQSGSRSLAVGIHMTGLYLGQALGGFGATIAEEYSWQYAFQLFGIMGILYSLLLVFLLKEKKADAVPATVLKAGNNISAMFRGVGLLLGNISFWILLFYFAVPSIPGWGVKNWLPTLFANKLDIEMATAGPLSTITIAASSFIGVLTGGLVSDRWVQKHLKGRIFTSAIGLGLTIPALLLVGFGTSLFHVVLAACCFGFGFGMFDANNMPILCQFVSARYRATAYGLMNMGGVFSGALITDWLGRSTDSGNLGRDFAALSVIVLVVLMIQLIFLKPSKKDADEEALPA